jgi:hypothetical protein
MPLISVFTPSHNPHWLNECWDSLEKQTYEDFEWVVLLNNGALWTPPKDPRVKLFWSDAKGVGALKRDAVEKCSGDILVELDHDDLLRADALGLIADAFDADPDASLVYSDFTQIEDDGSPNLDRFAEGHGWTYRMEGEYQVIEAKPPTPHNVSYVWYAPNHVRAISAACYEKAGGYNPDLTVCDDIDLICRLYQVGGFVHTPESLYSQRMHKGNTQREPATNALIQRETVRIYDENVQPNALAWAQREGWPCYDLGGAHNSPEGYEPIDQALGHGDILDWLARQPDDSVGVFRAVDFLEHVADKVTLMNELYRVLTYGGMLLSLTPSTDGRGAFCDPTHTSYWNQLSFRYYCDPEFAKYVPAITARFRQSRLETYYPTQWHQDNLLSYVLFNGVKEG